MKVSFVLICHILVQSLLQSSAIVLNSDAVKHEERTNSEHFGDRVLNTGFKTTSDGFSFITEDGFLTSVNNILNNGIGQISVEPTNSTSFAKEGTLNDAKTKYNGPVILNTKFNGGITHLSSSGTPKIIHKVNDKGGFQTLDFGILPQENNINQASQLSKLETADNRRLSFKKEKPISKNTTADSSAHLTRPTTDTTESFGDISEEPRDSILYNSQIIHLPSGKIKSLHGEFKHGVFIKDIQKTLVSKKVEMYPGNIKSQHVNSKGKIGNEAKDVIKHNDVEIHDRTNYFNLEDFFFGYDLGKNTKKTQSTDQNGLQTPINNNNQKNVHFGQHLQENLISQKDINPFTAGEELTFSVDLNNDFTDSQVNGANSLIQNFDKKDLPAKGSQNGGKGDKNKFNMNRGNKHELSGISSSKEITKPFTADKEFIFSVDLNNVFTKSGVIGAKFQNKNFDQKDLPAKGSQNGGKGDKNKFKMNQGNKHDMSEISSSTEITKPFTADKEFIFLVDLNNVFTKSGVIGAKFQNQNFDQKDLPSKGLQNDESGAKSKLSINHGHDHKKSGTLSNDIIKQFTAGKELIFSVDLNNDFTESGVIGANSLNQPSKHSEKGENGAKSEFNVNQGNDHAKSEILNKEIMKPFTAGKEIIFSVDLNNDYTESREIGANSLNQNKVLPFKDSQNGENYAKSKLNMNKGNDHKMSGTLGKEITEVMSKITSVVDEQSGQVKTLISAGKTQHHKYEHQAMYSPTKVEEKGSTGVVPKINSVPLDHSDGFQSLIPENLNLRKTTNIIARNQGNTYPYHELNILGKNDEVTGKIPRYKAVTSDNETPDPMGRNSGFIRTAYTDRNMLGLGNLLRDKVIIGQGMSDNRNSPASRSYNSRMVAMPRSDFGNIGDVRSRTISYETNGHGFPREPILGSLQINAPTRESWAGNGVGIERISPNQMIGQEIRRGSDETRLGLLTRSELGTSAFPRFEFGRHQHVLDSESRNGNRQTVSFPHNIFNRRLLDSPLSSSSSFESRDIGPTTDFSSSPTGGIARAAVVSARTMIQPQGYRRLF